MICKSSDFTWELVTILNSSPAKAAAAMVPTAYSAVDIPRSLHAPDHRRTTVFMALIGAPFARGSVQGCCPGGPGEG